MTGRGISNRITKKQSTENPDIREFWKAALTAHLAAGHETFGWHRCTEPMCVEKQAEFDGRYL